MSDRFKPENMAPPVRPFLYKSVGGRPRAAFTVAASLHAPALRSFASHEEAHAWVNAQDVARKRTYWIRAASGASEQVVVHARTKPALCDRCQSPVV